MFDVLHLVSGSSWTYAVVLAIAAIDAFFPLVPREATAIAATRPVARLRPCRRGDARRRRA
jgi:hypothetical protein